jgi:Putative prokaryotic signal transducing protein
MDDKLRWALLTEVQGRWQADLLKSYFESCGIEVELFQESLGQHIYPSTLDILGNVQLFVSKEQMEDAKRLLEEYYKTEEE